MRELERDRGRRQAPLTEAGRVDFGSWLQEEIEYADDEVTPSLANLCVAVCLACPVFCSVLVIISSIH